MAEQLAVVAVVAVDWFALALPAVGHRILRSGISESAATDEFRIDVAHNPQRSPRHSMSVCAD